MENPHRNLDQITLRSEDLKNFVNICLEKEPERRPNYDELQQNNFIISFEAQQDPKTVIDFCQTILSIK